MYYKEVQDGYINALHICGVVDTEEFIEISESEYYNIVSICENKPEDTKTIVYKLDAETLEYVETPAPEPEPEPEPRYTLDEAAEVIMQEVASHE